jgi:hypothetical protein
VRVIGLSPKDARGAALAVVENLKTA